MLSVIAAYRRQHLLVQIKLISIVLFQLFAVIMRTY